MHSAFSALSFECLPQAWKYFTRTIYYSSLQDQVNTGSKTVLYIPYAKIAHRRSFCPVLSNHLFSSYSPMTLSQRKSQRNLLVIWPTGLRLVKAEEIPIRQFTGVVWPEQRPQNYLATTPVAIQVLTRRASSPPCVGARSI